MTPARAMAAACATALVAAACAPALREPPPVSALAPGARAGRSADELLRAAEAAWARRGEPGQAAAAQALYLDAADADQRGAAALLGAMRAMTYRVEREGDVEVRGQLAVQEVELGQWCQRRAPAEPACDYRLAIALGQQARERPGTGRDALGKMLPLLRKAIAASPGLESGGPHRVLALLLLRAPAWPIGPGDLEAALEEARAAAGLFPDAPENQVVLGEAFGKNGQPEAALAAYRRARALAAAHPAEDPGSDRVLRDAEEGIARYGTR